jgi:pimeloyl-ACP methyl ester carboxylesterase
MEALAAVGEWIADNESLFSGAAAIIVLLSVIASALGLFYRFLKSRRMRETAPVAADIPESGSEKITLKDLSAPAPYEVRFAQSDGLRIAYAILGGGSQDMLMTPGIISHLNIMSHMPPIRDTMAACGKFARVATFDKRGQGLSDPCVNVPDMTERVHDIEAVLDAAGMDEVILYGVSEGGPMCIQFAHDHPERVKGLVLLGTAARWLQTDDYPAGINESALDSMPQAWGKGTLRDLFFPSISRDRMDDHTYRGFEQLIATRASIRQLVDFMKQLDVTALLPGIQVPTLVIHFAGDLAVPIRLGRAVAEGITGAEFLAVPGVDHADLSQSPEALARMRQFVDTLV